MVDRVARVLPTLGEPSSFFWTSGADGLLRFLRCDRCAYLIHPPTSYCPACGSREATPSPVSGRGTLHSFTVNHQPWDGTVAPYVIAVIAIEEQPDVRLLTNLVDVAADDVEIGMPVEVVFAAYAPVYLPLFRPASP